MKPGCGQNNLLSVDSRNPKYLQRGSQRSLQCIDTGLLQMYDYKKTWTTTKKELITIRLRDVFQAAVALIRQEDNGVRNNADTDRKWEGAFVWLTLRIDSTGGNFVLQIAEGKKTKANGGCFKFKLITAFVHVHKCLLVKVLLLSNITLIGYFLIPTFTHVYK